MTFELDATYGLITLCVPRINTHTRTWLVMRNNDERVSENDELLDEPRSLFPREKKAHDAEKMFNRRENCYAEFETQRASQRVLSIKLGSRSSAKICYAKRNCNNE